MNNTTIHIDDISALITAAVSDVFATMLSMEATPIPPAALRGSREPSVAGSVGFIGDVNGVVYFRASAAFAITLAAHMLGMTEAEVEAPEMVNDVVGELTNIIAGGVKSRLCDDGSPCVLTIPSVIRGNAFTITTAGEPEVRHLCFRAGDDEIIVELIMKPLS